MSVMEKFLNLFMKLKTDWCFALNKQQIKVTGFQARFSSNTEQFQSRSRSHSPYRYFDRQITQNTKPYQPLDRSLSPLRSNLRVVHLDKLQTNIMVQQTL